MWCMEIKDWTKTKTCYETKRFLFFRTLATAVDTFVLARKDTDISFVQRLKVVNNIKAA